MDFLINKINDHLDEQLIKITISNPRKAEEIKKYTIRPVLVRDRLLFQSAAYTRTQVFHENLEQGGDGDFVFPYKAHLIPAV